MAESKKMREKGDRAKKLSSGRKRSMKLSALNITTHPHSPQGYVDLLTAARRMRSAVPLRAKFLGRIGVFAPVDDKDPLGPYYGEFHRYFNIKLDGLWYDEDKEGQADEESVKLVSIPVNLKPDYEPFRFTFYPSSHKLVFQTEAHGQSKLVPRHAKKILDGLFSSPRLQKSFGKVAVVVEPEVDTVERIFKMKALRRLEIVVKRPNADDLVATQKKVKARLEAEGAERLEEVLVAPKGASLTVTDETKQVARVAASNGTVVGYGRRDDGISRPLSTKDHPILKLVEYFAASMHERDAFMNGATELLASLLQNQRKK